MHKKPAEEWLEPMSMRKAFSGFIVRTLPQSAASRRIRSGHATHKSHKAEQHHHRTAWFQQMYFATADMVWPIRPATEVQFPIKDSWTTVNVKIEVDLFATVVI